MANISRTEGAARVASTGVHPDSGYVDWPAILVGAVLAAAVSFVLHTFGAGIGLSLVSPFGGDGIGGTGILIAMALWVAWVIVSSFMIGGYVAGRLRRRVHDATEHEVDIRDGMHGLAVWAAGVLVSVVALSAGVGTAIQAGSNAAGGAAEAVASAADDSPASADRYTLESLLRPQAGGDTGNAGSSFGPGTQQMGANRMALWEFSSIFRMSGERGEFTEDDKAYMASVVSSRTGLSQEDAAQRVERLTNQYIEARQEALDAAEVARKTSVVAAFVMAASLLIAAAGAWWAATLGGRHRDEQTVITFFATRR